MQKSWSKWYEVCENCGGEVQVLSHEQGWNMACDLDIARCRNCYCQGQIMRDTWGCYVEWPDDMCAKCYRDLDVRLAALAVRVKEDLIKKYSTLREVKVWMETDG